jgi:hypothetical protein
MSAALAPTSRSVPADSWDGLDRPPLALTQRFFDNLFAFPNGVNDGVNKGKHEEKRAIIQTYWLQCRP